MPGGLLVVTIPNPRAPEFRFAANTPQWVHKAFKPDGFQTHYAYESVSRMMEYLEKSEMRIEQDLRAPVVGAYLSRLPWWASWPGTVYDHGVFRLAIVPLCGARRPGGAQANPQVTDGFAAAARLRPQSVHGRGSTPRPVWRSLRSCALTCHAATRCVALGKDRVARGGLPFRD